jgi:hypothetical protein
MIGSGYMEPGSPVFPTSQNASASVPRKSAQLLLECVIEAKRMLLALAASYDERAKRAKDRKHAAKP